MKVWTRGEGGKTPAYLFEYFFIGGQVTPPRTSIAHHTRQAVDEVKQGYQLSRRRCDAKPRSSVFVETWLCPHAGLQIEVVAAWFVVVATWKFALLREKAFT